MARLQRSIIGARHLLMAVGLAALVVAIFMAVETIAPPTTDDADTARTKTSVHELYVVSIRPETTPVPQGRKLAWAIIVTTAEGEPVQNAGIAVGGDMPENGHGMPTAPRVTKYLGEGKYLVQGIEFDMAGKWELRFDISSPHGEDTVAFDVAVGARKRKR